MYCLNTNANFFFFLSISSSSFPFALLNRIWGPRTDTKVLSPLGAPLRSQKETGPGQVAQLVRALSQHTNAGGPIPSQGTFKEQPMNALLSEPQINVCFSLFLFLSLSLVWIEFFFLSKLALLQCNREEYSVIVSALRSEFQGSNSGSVFTSCVTLGKLLTLWFSVSSSIKWNFFNK